MIEDSDREETGMQVKIVAVTFTFFALIVIGNVISSLYASDFGLTYSEMMEEVWLAALYIAVGGIGFFAIGRAKWPKLMIFAGRIVLALVAVSMVHNQFTTSRELAGIKKDFAIAASNCHVKGEELVCGKDLRDVLKRRDAKLQEMSAVVLNDWHVTAVRRDITIPQRAGAYLFLPF